MFKNLGKCNKIDITMLVSFNILLLVNQEKINTKFVNKYGAKNLECNLVEK